MVNDNLAKLTATLLKTVSEFKIPTDALLSKFFRDNRRLKPFERNIVAETIYTALKNYSKLGQAVDLKYTYKAVGYVWLHWLKIDPQQLQALTAIKFQDVLNLPKPNLQAVELPDWVINRLAPYHTPEQIFQLSRAMEQQAPLVLRVNSQKISVNEALKQLALAQIDAVPTNYSPYGIKLAKKADLMKNKLFLDGAIEVQDESSQLASLLLSPKRSDMVVDFCAGSGGKTLALGMFMKNSGRIYAFDINERRLGNLSPRLARSGLSNVYPQLIENEHDVRISRLWGKIDCVFVDAPCLGLGTIRRNPDLKFRYNEDDLANITKQQLSILTAASKLLKPGGKLVYATCSILIEENQMIVEEFLQHNPAFELQSAPKQLAIDGLANGDSQYLVLNPAIHDTDGFFAALMIKR